MGTNHMSYILSVINILPDFNFLQFKQNCKKNEKLFFSLLSAYVLCGT